MSRNFPNTLSAKAINAFRRRASCALTVIVGLILLANPFSALSRLNESQLGPNSSATTETQDPSVANVDSFIIEVVNGVVTCREARPSEVPLTLPRPDDRGTPITRKYFQDTRETFVSTGENVSSPLTINLVALSQLNSDPNKEPVIAAFQRAAANWTARIKSPTTVTVNIDYGPNPPGSTQPFDANVLGSTSSQLTQVDYPGVRINLNASASSATEANIYSALPTGSVPTDTGNGSIVSVSRTVARQLGFTVSATPAADATIGFNSTKTFDFNPDDGITPGQTDFVAVATHEIGHALGFTSGAGSGPASVIRLWDLFRFRPGTTTASFPTAQRIMSIGVSPTDPQVYFTGQTFQNFSRPTSSSPPSPIGTTQELGLSTGGPNPPPMPCPSSGSGDCRQSSHWKADEQVNIFVGIMDPTITAGVREDPTENDFLALEMIGWDLTGNAIIPPPPPAPPPPPPPVNDNFADALTLVGCSGTAFGTNVGATKEPNERDTSVPDTASSTRSVWYKWEAPSTGTVTFDTKDSTFDTVLEVFTGTSLATLTSIANNDDVLPDDPNTPWHDVYSVVMPSVTQGTTYWIYVNGFDNPGSNGGDVGSIKLHWTETGCTEPARFLIPENSDPNSIAALDSVTFVRGPFHINNPNNFSSDQRTRVMFLILGLGLTTADTSAVSVQAGTSPLPVDNVGPLTAPGLGATFVIVVLPSGLSAEPANFPLNVSVRGVACSNKPVLQIAGP